jgi:hypothetical protein
VHRFSIAEVDAITPQRGAARRPSDPARCEQTRRGRLAATVFRLFARGLSLPQIVVATRQPPETIRDLYREWSTTLDDGEWERRSDSGR